MTGLLDLLIQAIYILHTVITGSSIGFRNETRLLTDAVSKLF